MRAVAMRAARPLRPRAAAGLRPLSSFASMMSPFGQKFEEWPRTSPNMVLNIVPEGEVFVVERLGRLHEVYRSGWFLAIPVVDRIAHRIDMRERALEILPQNCITKDNVRVMVAGNIYARFVNPERAAYGNENPLYAVRQFAQSSMRAAIGEMELDDILRARTELNTIIRKSLQDAADAWGIDVLRYEITEISPDAHIAEMMDKQAAAERLRREKVLNAEGEKRAATLESEGVRTRLVNESEGERIAIENQAEARKKQLILTAQGEAEAVSVRAAAQAQALQTIANALQGQGGAEAATLHVAQRYIDMYGEIGSKSNTMIFNDKPGDVNALLAQAALALKSATTPDANSAPQIPGSFEFKE
mmetsp:Transcript_6740/g.19379  ORF Transcript_6740/g.19379 Transcript_6740/m.19379 type:complete len:361 (-) Transcript_6740:1705-2787(-)